jgi:hypothetical protein
MLIHRCCCGTGWMRWSLPGVVSSRRYKLVGRKGQGPAYLALYELDADDVRAPLRELGARVASGEIAMSDVIQQDPAPTITLYELTD